MTGELFGAFRTEVRSEGDHVAVAVHGGLDASTAPRLASVLHLLVDRGRTTIVLDLGYMRFMDVAGLQAVASTSEQLSNRGVTLTVRAAPPITRRVHDLTRPRDPVEFDPSREPAAEAELVRRSTAASEQERANAAINDLLRSQSEVRFEVVDAALRLVTALAAATVDNADGVSVTLERQGQLLTVAASDDAVERMDGHQYVTGEGPCLAARATGHVHHIESLDDEERWPEFVPRALKEGIHSILSSPLMAGDQSLGALNIYSNMQRAFDDRAQMLATLFAAQASDVLTRAHAEGAEDERLKRRLIHGLVARDTIALATGALMQHHHITAAAAAQVLFHSARAAELTTLQYATQLLSPFAADDAPDAFGR